MRHFTQLLLITALGIIVYSNTFNASFHFDDNRFIVKNPFIKDFAFFLDSSEVDLKAESNRISEDVRKYFKSRMFGFLSFFADYKLYGLDVRGYHAFNPVIHIINAFLVFSIVLLTFSTPGFDKSALIGHSGVIAMFSGLLFIAHPLQTEAVTYILQRIVVLAAMCYLLTITAYIGARLSKRSLSKYGLYSLSIVSAVLAMKTKESAFTLPLSIALYEVMFFRNSIKRRILYLTPFLLTMLIIPATYIGLDASGVGLGEVLDRATRLEQGVSRWDYLFTQFNVVARYIGLLVLPINQSVDHSQQLYHSFFRPQVFISFLFLVAMLGLGAHLYNRSRTADRSLRLAAFGIFFYFIALSVESSVLPIGEAMVEYRAYLPSAGLLISVVILLYSLSQILKVYDVKATVAVLSLLALSLAGAAYARNSVWHNDVSLWEDAALQSPGNARAHVNLGLAYAGESDLDRAIKHYLIALELEPEYAEAHNNLGVAYSSMGMIDKAINHLWAALKFMPDYADAHNNLGIIYNKQGLYNSAIKEYVAALKSAPRNAQIHNNLGITYMKLGRLDEAVKQYRTALEIRPYYAEAHNNLGVIYFDIGRLEDAAREYRTALYIDPYYEDAKYNLDLAYEMMQKVRNRD
jgi:tetratricopeptide (TPR) repeat protein